MPVTVTFSLKVTWIETVAPALYEPFAVDEVTPLTVGAVVSMTMSSRCRGGPPRRALRE